MEDMKEKLVDKDFWTKLQLDRMSKLQQKIIKLKDKGAKANEENKKLKTKIKQTVPKLEEARDGVIDLA